MLGREGLGKAIKGMSTFFSEKNQHEAYTQVNACMRDGCNADNIASRFGNGKYSEMPTYCQLIHEAVERDPNLKDGFTYEYYKSLVTPTELTDF